MYRWFFIALSLAQGIFVVTWLLLTQETGRVILLSLIIYTGAMIIGYIAYQVEKYRKRKKELIDNLPQS